MGISCKIYDIRRRYGGITEPGARSALLSHAHKCNTSLETMLVSGEVYLVCVLHFFTSSLFTMRGFCADYRQRITTAVRLS